MWAMQIHDSKPKIMVNMKLGNENVKLSMLVDTGADVTVISQGNWPAQWPVVLATGALTGVGGSTLTKISKENVVFEMPDGGKGIVRPFVTAVPMNLLGRDILGQLGCTIRTEAPFR